uniref:Uncharacterized protein n=1 Tax=Avena sativa TaxID=4498 RepID=A0ACD5WRQ4_AVESA
MRSKDLTFATRPRSVMLDIVGCNGRGILLAPYGDHWREMRKICIVELLSAKQVKRMESIKAEEVAHLVRHLTESSAMGRTVNLSHKMSELTNNIIARALFGAKCRQQGEYLRELDQVIKLVGGFSLVDLFPSSRIVRWFDVGERNMRKSYGRIQRIIAHIIEERKAARAASVCSTTDEDLLDVLLRLQADDSLPVPLTEETIGVVIFDIFAGGTETSSTTMEWAMSELLKNPEVLSKVHLELKEVLGSEREIITNADMGELRYMRMVIKESLRLHPPGPLLAPRQAREDCEIMDYHIARGTIVHINVFAISRDPRYWDNPEAFNPERFQDSHVDFKGSNFEFTPFGAGRRQCPGILFGTSTLEIVLANLLYHFNWLLPEGSSPMSLDMSEKFGMTTGRRSDLQLIPARYAL